MAHLRKTETIEGKQATLKELNAMFQLEEEEDSARGRRSRRNIRR
jgi:glutamyl-tRNA reductase